MKRFFFLGLSMFFLFFGIIESQAQYTPQNVLKVNLLGIGVGGFSVAYERTFTDNKSAVLTGRFVFFDFKDTKTFTFSGLGAVEVDYSVDLQLIGLLPEVRFYVHSFFEKDAPEGLYLAPYVGFTRTKFKVGSLTSAFTIDGGTTLTFLELGGTLGYQFMIGDRFVIDLFSGLGFTTFTLESVEVAIESTTSNERVNDLIQFDRKLPLGATLTGILPRFGVSIGIAF